MIGLGWRLLVAGGRANAIAIGLTALAVAIGTAFLLFALSFEPAMAVRYDHAAWRDTPGQLDLATADRGLMISRTDDHVAGRQLVRMDVAPLSRDAPLPPGIPRMPAPGEAFVSPALAALVEAMPADQLGDRFGTIVGTIDDAGLMAPDELAAIVGRGPEALRADGARVVLELNGAGRIPMPPSPLLRVLVIVAVAGALAPVAVFVATATRLGASRREQRLAAIRLVGATPGQVAVLGAVEALAATIPGALGGVALFFLTRPLIARVPLDRVTWFVDAIAPPLLPAVVLLVVVQVVGVLAAVVALRRAAVSPLGVRQRERTQPLRRVRLVPLVACLASLGYVVARIGSDGRITEDVQWLLAGSFFGVVVGVAIAGPWLTAAVGHLLTRVARGPVVLLAGHRLVDEPRGAFSAIGGVVMAVFVGSAYLSIAGFAGSISASEGRLGVRTDALVASIPGDGSRADAAVERTRLVDGVEAVAVIREVGVQDDDRTQYGVVAECEALVAVLAAPDLACGPNLVHLGPGGEPVTEATLWTSVFLGRAGGRAVQVEEVRLSVSPGEVGRYAPADLGPESAPGLPAVIVEPSALDGAAVHLPVTRLVVATDGSTASIERARTAIQVALPTSVVRTVSEAVADGSAYVTELGRVVSLGVVVAMLLAGASLAIAVATGLLERQRPFGLLRLAGMPVGRLRAVVIVEAAAPLVAVAVLSAVLGVAVAQFVIRSLGAVPVAVPPADPALAVLLAVATSGALAVVALALPLVDRLTRPDAVRFE